MKLKRSFSLIVFWAERFQNSKPGEMNVLRPTLPFPDAGIRKWKVFVACELQGSLVKKQVTTGKYGPGAERPKMLPSKPVELKGAEGFPKFGRSLLKPSPLMSRPSCTVSGAPVEKVMVPEDCHPLVMAFRAAMNPLLRLCT